MTRDPWATKPRPVKTVLAGVTVALAAGFLLHPGSSSSSQGGQGTTATSTVTRPVPSPLPIPTATADPATAGVAAAAVAGVTAWQTLDPKTRAAALTQVATHDYVTLVAIVPAEELPTAPPIDTYDTTVDDETLEAHTTVALQDGARLLVTLDGSTGRWLVDDIQET